MYKFYIPYLAAIIIKVNDIEHYLIANRSTSLLHVIITSTSELVTISSNCCNILFFFVKFSHFFLKHFGVMVSHGSNVLFVITHVVSSPLQFQAVPCYIYKVYYC